VIDGAKLRCLIALEDLSLEVLEFRFGFEQRDEFASDTLDDVRGSLRVEAGSAVELAVDDQCVRGFTVAVPFVLHCSLPPHGRNALCH
jgi:hypothetical protein